MELCPHCKKTSLELVNKPSKVSEILSYICCEIMIGLVVLSIIVWQTHLLTAITIMLLPIATMAYLILRKKENPLSQCSSCNNVFDEKTIQKAQRYV